MPDKSSYIAGSPRGNEEALEVGAFEEVDGGARPEHEAMTRLPPDASTPRASSVSRP